MTTNLHTICRRVVLAGAAFVALAAAAIAWFSNRPLAELLFNVGIALVGIGVLSGWVGMLVQRFRK